MGTNGPTRRGAVGRVLDFVAFPIRAVTLFHKDRWGLSSLASERFDWVAREVGGYCLDVGCGRGNRFIRQYRGGRGQGIDVFPYEGLTRENVVVDLARFPYPAEAFDSVTFIANINHVPESQRDTELKEAYRVLCPGGNIVVTMGHPLAEILVHRVVYLYDRILKTQLDMDSERGMHEEEAYFLTEAEIRERLDRAGFRRVQKKRFWTQWGLNCMFIGWKV
jgi:SAM-dependent methyltransferase